MKIKCQGLHCPAKNQCANYEKNITTGEERRTVSNCRSQKSFIKKEDERKEA